MGKHQRELVNRFIDEYDCDNVNCIEHGTFPTEWKIKTDLEKKNGVFFIVFERYIAPYRRQLSFVLLPSFSNEEIDRCLLD